MVASADRRSSAVCGTTSARNGQTMTTRGRRCSSWCARTNASPGRCTSGSAKTSARPAFHRSTFPRCATRPDYIVPSASIPSVVHETDTGNARSDENTWMRLILDTVGKVHWPADPQGRPIYPEGFEELAKKLDRPLHPPGRDIRCIVSVGMLTEGWDCNTVTHVVGLRPFQVATIVRAGGGPGIAPAVLQPERKMTGSTRKWRRYSACRSRWCRSRRPAPRRSLARRSGASMPCRRRHSLPSRCRGCWGIRSACATALRWTGPLWRDWCSTGGDSAAVGSGGDAEPGKTECVGAWRADPRRSGGVSSRPIASSNCVFRWPPT